MNDERKAYQQALTSFLGDRPIAYHPRLANLVGGVKSAIMLCQLLYWNGDQTVQERNGWIYKEIDTMEIETGLTHEEQSGARRKLIGSGLIEAKLEGMPRVWLYRINMDALGDLLLKYPLAVKSPQRHHFFKKEAFIGGKTPPMLEAKLDHLKPETTTEIEHGEKKISPNPLSIPVTYPIAEESVTLVGKKDNLIKDPRVGAYRGLAHLTPNQVQREEICNRVTDLELWQTIITGWLGHGWNPKNITGMLEVYEKGGLEKSGRNNGHKTTINPGTDREVNPNYPTGVTKSDGVPGWNETYYERTETE